MIESFAFLLVNINTKPIMYYFFSSNFINKIISKDFSWYDEDFLSYYVNFLKSLSQRIDETTILFFFQTQTNSFPLVECAIRYYNFPDSMIKNVVKNVIWTILKIKNPKWIDHFTQLPSIKYFTYIVLNLAKWTRELNREIKGKNEFKIKSIHDDILDELIYIDDWIKLNIPKLIFILLNAVFYYFVFPVLMNNLICTWGISGADSEKKSNESDEKGKPRTDADEDGDNKISVSVTLYMWNLIMINIKNETFTNAWFTVLFFDCLHKDMNSFLSNTEYRDFDYYDNTWSKQKQHRASVEEFIKNRYSCCFFYGLMSVNYSREHYRQYPQLIQISEEFKWNDKKTPNVSMDERWQSIENSLILFLPDKEWNDFKQYHKSLSMGHGMKLGVFETSNMANTNDDVFDMCFLCSLKLFYEDIKLRGYHFDNTSKTQIKNPIKSILFNLLKSKDDTTLLLMNLLIYNSQNSGVCRQFLSNTGWNVMRLKSKVISEGKMGWLDGSISINTLEDDGPVNKVEHNFYLFDNEFCSTLTKYVHTVNHDWINELVAPICRESLRWRKATVDVILYNIKTLTLNSEGYPELCLRQSTVIAWKESYRNIIISIKNTLKYNFKIRESAFGIFKDEWRRYSNCNCDGNGDSARNASQTSTFKIPGVIKELFVNPYVWIADQSNCSSDIPPNLRPWSSPLDILKYEISMLFTLMETLSWYVRNTHEKIPFPIEYTKHIFEVNNSYSIHGLDINEYNWYNTAINIGGGEWYKDRLIIIYKNFIYFTVVDTEGQKALVEYKNELRNCQTERTEDTMKLKLLVKEEDKESEVFYLKFGNDEDAESAFRYLDNKISVVLNNEFILFNNYIEDLYNQESKIE